METLFDIGDKIRLTLEGTVKSFSISKDGDCYVVYINDKSKDGIPIYLNSQALITSNARKVGD